MADSPASDECQPIDKWKKAATQKHPKIDEVLADPNTTLESILRHTQFSSLFQAQNPDLVSRVTTEESILEIFDLVQTTQSHFLLAQIQNAFLLPGSPLMHGLAIFPATFSKMAEILQQSHEDNAFRIGLVTQFLIYSVAQWPSDVLPNFLSTDSFLPAIVQNVVLDSIYYSFLQIVTIQPSWFHSYLWAFLISIIHTIDHPSPLSWNVSGNLSVKACSELQITQQHRSRLLKIITAYFAAFPNEYDFRAVVHGSLGKLIEVVVENEEKQALFQIGLELKSSSLLLRLAFDSLLEQKPDLKVLESALKYLSTFADGNNLNAIPAFIFRALNGELPINHFILQMIIKLCQELVEKADAPRFFAKIVQHCIAYSVNHSEEAKKLNFRSALLELSLVVGDLPAWGGWVSYMETTVDNFSQANQFDRNFRISEDGMDVELLEKLKNHEREIIMKMSDIRQVVDNTVFNNSDDDSRSALSGSYMSDDEEYEDETVPRGILTVPAKRPTDTPDQIDGLAIPSDQVGRKRSNTIHDHQRPSLLDPDLSLSQPITRKEITQARQAQQKDCLLI